MWGLVFAGTVLIVGVMTFSHFFGWGRAELTTIEQWRALVTAIMPCTCQHEGQDKMYGKGRRIHNPLGPKKKQSGLNWHCSVCGKEKK